MITSTTVAFLAFLFPQDLRTERVYYDGVDERGRLTGGTVELSTPLAPAAQGVIPAPVQVLALSGDPGNRVDIVFVGDGYQAGELGLYASHVSAQAAVFFQREPFTEYAEYFNVHQVDVISNESGVDNDPTQGILRDTALDMRFWCSGIERLLCVDVGLAYSFAGNAPDVDLVAAIANSTKYGGAGYPSSDLATASGGNSSSAEVLLHEFGHALGNLADEYHYSDGATYTGPEVGESNASIRTATEQTNLMTKWFRWVGTNDPSFDGLVNSFEGARYYQFGIYRPTNNSLMRSLGRPFNLPSIEEILRQIYVVVDPIDDASSTVTVYDGTETLFVLPMQPAGHALDIQWALDGADITGATATTLDLRSLNLSPGLHSVSVTVVDNTTWVRDEAARSTLMTGTRTFSVDRGDQLGTRYCTPAVPNSTGFPGAMVVTGSATVADDELTLTASQLPVDSNIGYFLMGVGTNTFTPPGAIGPICVTPGLERYLPPVNNTDELPGGFTRDVGTSGPISGQITAGSTWNFQAWHRDSMAGTSNLTDAVSVTFN